MGSTHRKRQRAANGADGDAGSASASASAVMALRRSVEPTTVKDALSGAFAGLDAIAHDAHLYHVQQQQQQQQQETQDGQPSASAPAGPTGWQSSADLKADVFAAMAAPHYEALRACVVACGLQLVPVLDGLVRRVALALATPLLSVSVEAWELAAVLCQYYRAGAVRLVEQLVEVLLREPGIFLLDASCLVPTSLAEHVVRPSARTGADHAHSSTTGTAAAAASPHKRTTPIAEPADLATHEAGKSSPMAMLSARRAWLAKVARKWAALTSMLHAIGPLLSGGLLHRFAVRFVLEVVEQGLLSSRARETYLVSEAALSASAGAVRLTSLATGAHPTLPGSVSAEAAALALEAWMLPLEWGHVCVSMLDVLLRVADPVAPELLAAADSLVRSLTASLHAGGLAPLVATEAAGRTELAHSVAMPSSSLYTDLVASTVSLQGTLRLLRNPRVLPMYVPPVVAAERPKRRVQLAAIPTPSIRTGADVPAASAAAPDVSTPHAVDVDGADGAVAAPLLGHSQHITSRLPTRDQVLPLPLPTTTSTVPSRLPPPAAAAVPAAPSTVSAVVRAVPVPPPAKTQPVEKPDAGVRNDEDDDDMPDIDLDD